MQVVKAPEGTSPEFLSLAKHDLSAKLRTIGQLAEFVRDDLGDTITADTTRHLDMIAERSDQMEALIKGLVEFEQAVHPVSRPDARLIMGDLLDDVLATIDGTAGIDVVLDLSPMACLADTATLGQCLGYLLENAVQHRRQRGGVVAISAKALQDFVEITIADDGVGFSNAHVEIAVQPLRKLAYRGRSVDGAGLGLAIATRLVSSNRGELQIHSTEGSGTSVRLRWPVKPAPDATTESSEIIWID